MADRPVDEGWDALVEVTGADVAQERGALNASLANIKRLTEEMDLSGGELAMMVHHRAAVYREIFPSLPLTATALAKWWDKVLPEKERLDALARTREQEQAEKTRKGVNLSVRRGCVTCGDDGWVVVSHRLPVQSVWAAEKGIKHRQHPSDRGFEETAPCPVCNLSPPVMRNFWDGKTWEYGPVPGELVIP